MSVNDNYYVLRVNSLDTLNKSMGLFDWIMPAPPQVNNYNNNSAKVDNHQELVNLMKHKAEHMSLTNTLLIILIIIMLLVIGGLVLKNILNKYKTKVEKKIVAKSMAQLNNLVEDA